MAPRRLLRCCKRPGYILCPRLSESRAPRKEGHHLRRPMKKNSRDTAQSKEKYGPVRVFSGANTQRPGRAGATGSQANRSAGTGSITRKKVCSRCTRICDSPQCVRKRYFSSISVRSDSGAPKSLAQDLLILPSMQRLHTRWLLHGWLPEIVPKGTTRITISRAPCGYSTNPPVFASLPQGSSMHLYCYGGGGGCLGSMGRGVWWRRTPLLSSIP